VLSTCTLIDVQVDAAERSVLEARTKVQDAEYVHAQLHSVMAERDALADTVRRLKGRQLEGRDIRCAVQLRAKCTGTPDHLDYVMELRRCCCGTWPMAAGNQEAHGLVLELQSVRSELQRVSHERMHLAAQLEAARLDGVVAGALARGAHKAPPPTGAPQVLPPSPAAPVFSPVNRVLPAGPGANMQGVGTTTSTTKTSSPSASTSGALSKDAGNTTYGQSGLSFNLASAKPAGVFLTPVALPSSQQHSAAEPWTAASLTPGTATASNTTPAVIAAARAAAAAATAAATVASIGVSRGYTGNEGTLAGPSATGTPAR
jgi:hypothetical protein